jgi:PKD repeat protein
MNNVFLKSSLARRFLVGVFLLVCHLAKGQITISQADMPGSGDTLRFSNALNAPASVYNLDGANQNWDFSTLSPASQDVASYKSSLQTSYAFFFLGLNKYGRKVADTLGVAAFQFTDVYNFYRKTTQAFEVEGIGLKYQGLPLPAYYTQRDKLYQFPLQFGDRDSSRLAFSIALSTLASYSQVGYRINEVSGWGSITTPFGTFNCLKLKSRIVTADSLNISGFPVKFNRVQVEYKWLANGIHIPVLEITGNEIGGTFLPTNFRYRDIPRSNVLLSPPLAQFSASQTQVSPAQPVLFTNTSQGSFLSYQWTFEPSSGIQFENNTSDTSLNPVVSFSDPGLYTVTLEASNFLGNDLEVKTNYIEVLPTVGLESLKSDPFKITLPGQVFALPFSPETLEVLDLTGRTCLKSKAEPASEWLIGLKPGIYLLHFQGQGQSVSRIWKRY